MANALHHNFSGWRVVVFGAGYVGSEVVRAAAAGGASVCALTRNPAVAGQLASQGVQVHVGNLAGDDWHGAFDGDFDLVVDCVGAGGSEIEGYRESYLLGMHSILRWCAGRGVGTLVYTSSTSVYAQGDGARIDEHAEASGRSPQSQVLVATEEALLSTEVARRRVVLRLAGIYGPARHHLLDLVRSGATEVAGVPGQHLNVIHRDDVVGAIMAVARAGELPATAVFNVCDDGEATRGEILGWLCGELGRPALRFAGVAPEGGRAPVPDRIISNAWIKQSLGWRPGYRSFRDGYAGLLGSPEDRGARK